VNEGGQRPLIEYTIAVPTPKGAARSEPGDTGNSCRPAVDPMFSVGRERTRGNGLAVVLTGWAATTYTWRNTSRRFCCASEASFGVWGRPSQLAAAVSDRPSRYSAGCEKRRGAATKRFSPDGACWRGSDMSPNGRARRALRSSVQPNR
jgi:hypothetical protein